MSRKDYVEAARIVREAEYLSHDARTRLVADLVTFFADDNPRFSASRFRAACQPEPSERDRLEARGYADGHAAGTWVEVEEEEQARRILAMLDEGDPEVYDWLPAPRLGGEYADEPTWADILAEEDCENSDDGRQELYDAYAYAWGVAMEREVVRHCRAMLGFVPEDLGSR
jgi:hypothetical protein